MKKILMLITFFVLYACQENEELTINTQVWCMIENESNDIGGTFCFFKKGEYEPLTFTEPETHLNTYTIHSKEGDVVKPLFVVNSYKNQGYAVSYCNPGEYTIVATIRTGVNRIWKMDERIILENKANAIETTFPLYGVTGYIGWLE